jgi:cyclic beta-1,2-glucan synthetase
MTDLSPGNNPQPEVTVVESVATPTGEADKKRDRLEEHARQLASVLNVDTSGRAGQMASPILNYFKDYQSFLMDAYMYFRGASEDRLTLSYAAEWMLDNYYIVQQTLREIRENLPAGFYKELPLVLQGRYQGYPRIYAVACDYLLAENDHLDMDRLERYLEAFQSQASLTMGEIWALPSMLRIAVVQALILAVANLTGMRQSLEKLRGENPFYTLDLSESMTEDEIVANSIISLRTLSTLDWKEIFEDLSQVEQILMQDPSGVYSRMDFETRDRYRNEIDRLARIGSIEEQVIARQAVKLSQDELDKLYPVQKGVAEEQGPDWLASKVNGGSLSTAENSWFGLTLPRTCHVGYYLVDKGRGLLETNLQHMPPWYIRFKRWLFRHATPVYLGSIFLLTLLFTTFLTIYLIASGSSLFLTLTLALLFFLISSSASVSLVNSAVTYLVSPRVLPKLDFDDGIAPGCSTMVVIPAILSEKSEAFSLIRQLELHYLRNTDTSLYFALATDFPDADQKNLPEDEELLDITRQGIQDLNRKYGQKGIQPFYLFHRSRQWNPQEGTWMGWERKRGKLHELNQLIMGKGKTSFILQYGDLSVLPDIRYVITLDADTILPGRAAHRLVATLAHPLNQADVDPRSGRVLAGYTVLQPRTEINPPSANRSLFTRIYSGDVGLDLYTLAVSDVYQDLFGEGTYVGKGIYDVRNFERSLEGVIPDNALLSHDLFEGIHGRAALVTDIVLVEDYPQNYLVHVRRMHRWIRGDWQLLPWLFPHVPRAIDRNGQLSLYTSSRLKLIDRWKIFDNLRRSLVAPALIFYFLVGWLWFPDSAWVLTLVGSLSLAAPLLISMLGTVVSAVMERQEGVPISTSLRPIRNDILRWLLALTFLPNEALVTLDAITITLVRLFITRKHLLQWTTSARTARLLGESGDAFANWSRMLATFVFAVIVGILLILVQPESIPAAAPLLILWLFLPQVAYLISRPIVTEVRPLESDQRRRLRTLSRHTWLYFEQYTGPEDHWLAPDHYQESPRGIIAHRTSPTNIGLALLSNLAAYDLGYTGMLDLAARLNATFENLHKLERHRGHFLNWYDTRSLEPLPPRYVSTVDSGNLAGTLVALGQGCLEMSRKHILRSEILDGFLDTLDLLNELINQLEDSEAMKAAAPVKEALERMDQEVRNVFDDPEQWVSTLSMLLGSPLAAQACLPGDPLLVQLEGRIKDLVEAAAVQLGSDNLSKLRIYTSRVRYQLESSLREVELLFPWAISLACLPDWLVASEGSSEVRQILDSMVEALPRTATLAEAGDQAKTLGPYLERLEALLVKDTAEPHRIEEARDWLHWIKDRVVSAGLATKALWIGFQEIHQECENFIREMDFKFLFDRERKVFHIGYNVELGRADSNYYDLLASEARIASLVAIARGHVPQSHWLHLSRPFTQVNSSRALLSWSATIFEYLMPDLLMRNYEGTLLYESSRAVVKHQIRYGESKGVPWGISESSYYHFDENMVYQYRAFGVPGLGFKRGLAEDLVISPYASLLALPYSPQAVVENLEKFRKLGLWGAYGLYDAVDFTPTRLGLGDKSKIVRSYMAHHQGMILVSLVNYLKDSIMVERFHADPYISSVELLLQEQLPQFAPLEQPHSEDGRVLPPEETPVDLAPWAVQARPPQPRAHYLSNGRYSLLISSSGAGYSKWRDINLTRFQTDTTLNNWGMWIYVQEKDVEKGNALWSAALQPTGSVPESHDVLFYPYQVEFRRRERDISVVTEVTIPPDDDLEVRLVTMTNHGSEARRMRLTSYGEVVLAPLADDQRHPAFNKLFIESEYLPDSHALLFRRRPRSATEKPLFLAHFLLLDPEIADQATNPSFESDRARFIGRGGGIRNPEALLPATGETGLTQTTGATLDPVMALSRDFVVEPHSTIQLAFITTASDSRQDILSTLEKYQDWRMVERAFDQSRAFSEVELRRLGIESMSLERFQKLLSVLLYPHASLRADSEVLASNQAGQPTLWAYGISGDYPILLLKIGSQEGSAIVRELLLAHVYWRKRGLQIDLILLNKQGADYGGELTSHLHQLITISRSEAWLNRRGGIFILHQDRMIEKDLILLNAAARVVLDGDEGTLADYMERLEAMPIRLPAFEPLTEAGDDSVHPVQRPEGLLFDNGYGGFSEDGCQYIVYVEPGKMTPAPWVNIIANQEFGFLISETGSGYTWATNSGENRLTPWNNDPVSDPSGEVLYLRDEETAEIWTPTPLPAPAPAPYLVRHSAGVSSVEHNSHGLFQRVRYFAAPEEPVKIIQVRLENATQRVRRITATYYAEWVLGLNRESTQQFVLSEYESSAEALLATNPYNTEFADRVAFLAADLDIHGLTADRTEFLGRLGSYEKPASLTSIGLASRVEAGVDPCGAIQVHIDLHPGEVQEFHFLLGQGDQREHALELVSRFRDRQVIDAALDSVNAKWERLLGTIQIQTPDKAMDLLLNRWLLYQSISCRIWGRSAFYQSSGAYGFRDQLQDVMSVLYTAPELAREHILLAARHQFEAGDVLHWWHPPSGRGVRTRYSDDLVWLPYVTEHYVRTTGDESILAEQEPFLEGPYLEPGEKERYGHYESSRETYSLYEHSRRALEKGSTAGPHGLPLIGAGDWNDGMNRVGNEGRGESVWLAWFLIAALERFSDQSEARGDSEHARLYRLRAQDYRKAVEDHAWDGEWYRRAYYDDGTPLGSIQNRECQIDAIAQSWAVLSGAGQTARANRAMQSVSERLVLPEERLILLFTPPFDKTARDPGYIKGYLPGIRENGGQYTHAALWTIWAFVDLGQGDQAGHLYRMINPIYHGSSREEVDRYKVEPYVIAADVYGIPPHTGRGGWTWYTGSAGWMYRLGLDGILGFRKLGDSLYLDPCIPSDWEGFAITYRYKESIYRIHVENPQRVNRGVKQVLVDGQEIEDGRIPLLSGGEQHQVKIVLGEKEG